MILDAISSFIGSKLFPLILSIVGLSLLIVVHEFGHFFFCKLFGIHTPTFSIGFGPKIVEKKIGSTNFRISRYPLGGYVEIAGLAEIGQGEQEFAQDTGETTFQNKPYWKKFLVLCGGILFNLAFAYLVFCTLLMIGSGEKRPLLTIAYVIKDSPAEKSDLKEGDKIIKINNKLLVNHDSNLYHAQQLLLREIRTNPNEEISFLIERSRPSKNNKPSAPIEKNINVTLTSKKLNGKTIGSLGAHFSTPLDLRRLPFLQAIKTGITITNQWIYNIAISLKNIIFKQRSLEGAGGPIMIIAFGFKRAQSGLIPLFIFLAIMSINLALFNLLPLGIVDGGQLLFATIEAIIRRPVPEIIRTIVNYLSITLLLFLFIYITYKDIVQLFGSIFANIFLNKNIP